MKAGLALGISHFDIKMHFPTISMHLEGENLVQYKQTFSSNISPESLFPPPSLQICDESSLALAEMLGVLHFDIKVHFPTISLHLEGEKLVQYKRHSDDYSLRT